jgi:hypothetical protein
LCDSSDRFYELIHCDRCGRGYHLECVYPHLDIEIVQTLANLNDWLCTDCDLLS